MAGSLSAGCPRALPLPLPPAHCLSRLWPRLQNVRGQTRVLLVCHVSRVPMVQMSCDLCLHVSLETGGLSDLVDTKSRFAAPLQVQDKYFHLNLKLYVFS